MEQLYQQTLVKQELLEMLETLGVAVDVAAESSSSQGDQQTKFDDEDQRQEQQQHEEQQLGDQSIEQSEQQQQQQRRRSAAWQQLHEDVNSMSEGQMLQMLKDSGEELADFWGPVEGVSTGNKQEIDWSEYADFFSGEGGGEGEIDVNEDAQVGGGDGETDESEDDDDLANDSLVREMEAQLNDKGKISVNVLPAVV